MMQEPVEEVEVGGDVVEEGVAAKNTITLLNLLLYYAAEFFLIYRHFSD